MQNGITGRDTTLPPQKVPKEEVVTSDFLQNVLPEPYRTWGTPSNLIIGESHYLRAFRAITAARVRGPHRILFPVDVLMEREPDNPHGSESITGRINGHIVGHLAKEVNLMLAPIMDCKPNSSFFLPGIIDMFPSSVGSGKAFACHLWHDECRDKRKWLKSALAQIGGFRVTRWPPPDPFVFDESLKARI